MAIWDLLESEKAFNSLIKLLIAIVLVAMLAWISLMFLAGK